MVRPGARTVAGRRLQPRVLRTPAEKSGIWCIRVLQEKAIKLHLDVNKHMRIDQTAHMASRELTSA